MPMRIVLNVHENMVDWAVEKKAVAAWVSSQTLASSEWLTDALHMGHRRSISKAKKWAKESEEGQKWFKKLQ